jgi:hypothetical protein
MRTFLGKEVRICCNVTCDKKVEVFDENILKIMKNYFLKKLNAPKIFKESHLTKITYTLRTLTAHHESVSSIFFSFSFHEKSA